MIHVSASSQAILQLERLSIHGSVQFSVASPKAMPHNSACSCMLCYFWPAGGPSEAGSRQGSRPSSPSPQGLPAVDDLPEDSLDLSAEELAAKSLVADVLMRVTSHLDSPETSISLQASVGHAPEELLQWESQPQHQISFQAVPDSSGAFCCGMPACSLQLQVKNPMIAMASAWTSEDDTQCGMLRDLSYLKKLLGRCSCLVSISCEELLHQLCRRWLAEPDNRLVNGMRFHSWLSLQIWASWQ